MTPWYKRQKFTLKAKSSTTLSKDDKSKAQWSKCVRCLNLVSHKDLDENFYICTHCEYHFSLPPLKRLSYFLDEGSMVELFSEIKPQNFLNFSARESYTDKLKDNSAKTGLSDAIVTAIGTLSGRPIAIGVMGFSFMGGSMGSVVGERIDRLCSRAIKDNRPLILFSCSGGARMQEGTMALMQLAKVCASLARLDCAPIPYISYMTNPTMGGVSASFASIGDICIAEPGSLIGFAGPRVIEQTIGETLPEGFQTAEFLKDHGFLDAVVSRREARTFLSQFLSLLIEA